MTDIPCVSAPRITTPRDQSTPTASAKRFRLLPKSMLSICLSGSWCGWNMGYTGALSAALRCRRLRVPTEIQTERADDRPVFSWTRTAVHLPAWAFRRSAPLRPGGRDHLSTAAALLTGPSTISMTSTDWGLQRSAVSSTVELAGIFGVIWTQSSTRATTCQVPHTRGSLFLPSTATCPGAKQILLRSSSDQPDCHPSCQKSAKVLLAGSSPSALRAASDRDRSPTFHGGQRDEKCPDAAQ